MTPPLPPRTHTSHRTQALDAGASTCALSATFTKSSKDDSTKWLRFRWRERFVVVGMGSFSWYGREGDPHAKVIRLSCRCAGTTVHALRFLELLYRLVAYVAMHVYFVVVALSWLVFHAPFGCAFRAPGP
jgi:hypothetical protein